MSRRGQTDFVFMLIFVVLAGGTVSADDVFDEDTARANAVRFASVLEKNPRRGTAFDKVYGYHVERGTLNDLRKQYSDKAGNGQGTEAASASMIVGLVDLQRGDHAEAIRAFARAEQLDTSNAMASYYLGQSLIAAGQSDPAAEAIERAIQRQPAPADLMEAFQTLGRLHLRAQKNDKALDIWNRLEVHFPNDPRVQEQIATTLLEENDLVAALPRFENLARSTPDKYRQSLFHLEAAEIKARLGRTDEALKDFDAQLKQLNPENWLYRDVRRRVEAVLLKGNNSSRLIAYYESCVEKNPEDLDAVSRLARLLSGAGRGPDAQSWLQRGLKVAPSNKGLRQTLIAQLLHESQFARAAEQYQELDRHDPNNPDTLREWGRVLLKDSTRNIGERRQAAAVVWRKMIASRPGDPHVASQVAELFRRAEMEAEATEQYRRAIELDPDAIQYREYLGEYLLSLKRADDALLVWREIATGPRRTASNVARLAELLARNNRLDEAIQVNAEACGLDPRDLNLQFKHVDLLSRAKQHDAALDRLTIARKLVDNDEELEAWLRRELETLKVLDRLNSRIVEVRRELEQAAGTSKPGDASRWYWLARAYEAVDQPRAALQPIARAMELDPHSVSILATAARLNEAERHLQNAIQIYTRLAAANRRFRTEYLQHIMNLEERLGRPELALKAGRELLAAAPGNPEVNDVFAQLCFRLKRHDEGIQTLRRSLRINPGDIPTLIKLASALGDRNQTTESIELLWRAFDRSQNIDERIAIVERLAASHAALNQVRKLLDRLERDGREPARLRDMTLCISKVHEFVGEFATAQRTLQDVLTDSTQDRELLINLVRLAERQRDLQTAIRYQRLLWQISADKSDRFHLAQLLLQSGQHDDAVELLMSEDNAHEITADVLKLLDGLYMQGHRDEVIARLKRLRERFPDNWELLYREGALLSQISPAKAVTRFEAIISMTRPPDEASQLGTSLRTPTGTTTRLPMYEQLVDLPRLLGLVSRRQQIQYLMAGQSRRGVLPQAVWHPGSYDDARMASWCWLLSLKGGDQFSPARQIPEIEYPVSRQQFFDRIVVSTFLGSVDKKIESARQMIELSEEDIEAKVLYLHCLSDRNSVIFRNLDGTYRQTQASSQPMPPEELETLQRFYHEIATRPDLAPLNMTLLRSVLQELSLAGRHQTIHEILVRQIANATSPFELAYLLVNHAAALDLTATTLLVDRLLEMQGQLSGASAPPGFSPTVHQVLLPEQLPRALLPILMRSSESDKMATFWSRFLRLHARRSVDLRAVGTPPPAVLPTGPVTSATPVAAQPRTAGRVPGLAAASARPAPDMPGIVYNAEVIAILDVVRRQFDRAGDSDKLIASFEREWHAAGTTADERLYWSHALAYLLWMNSDRDAALQTLEEAARQAPARWDLKLGLASQYEVANQPARSLALLDAIHADPASGTEENPVTTVRLAIAAEQIERAQTVAVQMARSSVPPAEIDLLLSQLIRLELLETAEELLERIGKSQPLGLGRLGIKMDLQLARGKHEEASAAAIRTLAYLDRLNAVNTFSSERQHCYKVLQATGGMAPFIVEKEKLLESSPRSESLIDALIACYTCTGDRARLDELTIRKLDLNPNNLPNQFALILKYLETDRPDDALKRMKSLVERDSRYFASRCHEGLVPFEGRKEFGEFYRLLNQLEWGPQGEELHQLQPLIEQLHLHRTTTGAADDLFVRYWEKHAQRRLELLERFKDDHWWQLKAVRLGAVSVLVPQSEAGIAEQWSYFGRALEYRDTDAGLVTVLNRLLSNAAADGTLDALAVDVTNGMRRYPSWTAGAVVLALIDLRRDRVQPGRETLEKLLSSLQPTLQDNPTMAWEIAQDLSRNKECLDAGVKYFMIAINHADRIDWASPMSAAAALVKAYVSHGRSVDARKLLWSHISVKLRQGNDTANIPSPDIAQATQICLKLRSLGYPVDAIEIYLMILERTDGMLIVGYDSRSEVRTNLIAAFGELKVESLPQYLEDFDETTRHLRVPLFVRQSEPERGRVQGRWDSMLNAIARNAELTRRTQAALSRLSRTQSGNLGPLVLSAQLSFAANEVEQAMVAANRLTTLLEQKPMKDEHVPGSSTRSQQAGEAGEVALWLVARECLVLPSADRIGKTLGQRALEASRWDRTRSAPISIMTEWIQIAARTGDEATAAQLQQELDKLKKP